MKTKLNCEIVKDLLPSYIDHLTSAAATEAVTSHLSECENCRRVYREMTNTEPPIAEQPEIDYLKKVRNSRRRIRNVAIIAASGVLVLGLVAVFITTRSKKKAEADAQTITELEQQTEADAQTITELEQQIELPTVLYDAETKALVITGADRYDEMVIPDEAEEAQTLDVQDDQFHMSVYIPLLQNGNEPLKTYLPSYIDRTDRSIRFLRSYLKENAPGVYPSDRADKMVEISIRNDNRLAYRNEADRILLNLDDYYWHREELYLFALMDTGRFGWEQLGYAWYVGSALDPYSELLRISKFDDTLPYSELCINAGIDFEQFTPADLSTVNDAIARVIIDRGLTGWGTAYESIALSRTALYQVGTASFITQDIKMSVLSAESFVAWLDRQYGFEPLTAFCFGQKTFDEAFGTDFDTAFNGWLAWLVETYPMN